ncbi:hypothetical protein SVIO_049000 [Streptomyces violaceusniger]|uniref:Uncharacterized protein n=2 Tax=Streptomyces violaceusniger TaxID=68280 RepID=A0A4D4L6I7_STRVO|nr:hypothetical protein SVIO_049000 [Streptomyces violaceusniger]
MPEPEEQPTTHAPAAAEHPEPSGSAVAGSTVSGSTAGGLPKRRRKGAISIVPRADSTTAAARTSEETASIMGAFQRGTQSGRSAANPSREGHDPQ